MKAICYSPELRAYETVDVPAGASTYEDSLSEVRCACCGSIIPSTKNKWESYKIKDRERKPYLICYFCHERELEVLKKEYAQYSGNYTVMNKKEVWVEGG